jgi:hypothetical protein
VNHELIFLQISPLGDPTTQSMTSASHEKSGCTQMPNSNDAASNEMLWERVLSLLVVGASVSGGSTCCCYRPYHHYFTDFHRDAKQVLTATVGLATAILTTRNSVMISIGQKCRKCQNGR